MTRPIPPIPSAGRSRDGPTASGTHPAVQVGPVGQVVVVDLAVAEQRPPVLAKEPGQVIYIDGGSDAVMRGDSLG